MKQWNQSPIFWGFDSLSPKTHTGNSYKGKWRKKSDPTLKRTNFYTSWSLRMKMKMIHVRNPWLYLLLLCLILLLLISSILLLLLLFRVHMRFSNYCSCFIKIDFSGDDWEFQVQGDREWYQWIVNWRKNERYWRVHNENMIMILIEIQS